jgi:hypothetical protein
LKSSALIARRAAVARDPVALGAVPDHRRRLSNGVLVDGSIVARILGLRLLTLEATIVLLPADVSVPRSASFDAPARSSAPAIPRWQADAGQGLAEAVQSIEEGAQLLAKARRSR